MSHGSSSGVPDARISFLNHLCIYKSGLDQRETNGREIQSPRAEKIAGKGEVTMVKQNKMDVL